MRSAWHGRARLLAAACAAALAGCSGFSFFVANAPNGFGSFERTVDVSYGPDARQRLDIYAPAHAHNRPVVIFFYGGSWATGRKSDYAFVGAVLAKHGYVVMIPDYRLYPQVRFPAFVDDGARAVAFAAEHAQEFGGDPDRLVVMGHSAGAYIAAMVALNPAYLEVFGVPRRRIVGLIGLSGPYALEPDTDTLRDIFGSPYTPSDWQPVRFATRYAPATLLLHGGADQVVYVSHTEKLRDALLAQGVDVETHIFPKRGHADTIASFTLIARFRTPALRQTLDFLGRITAEPQAAPPPSRHAPAAATSP